MNRQTIFSDESEHTHQTQATVKDAAEYALDRANEMTFPASDPIAISNITRIAAAPEMAHAAAEHQNSSKLEGTSKEGTRESPPAGQERSKEEGGSLKYVKIAALVTDGFEESELMEPKHALEALGAIVEIIADKSDGKDSLQAFKHIEKSIRVPIDTDLHEANVDEYAGVLLPGGVINGDAMRTIDEAQRFLKEIDQAGKPIAAICHGGWLLISAGLARGRTVTSWPSLQDDFRNAGGHWVDQDTVQDGNLVTARKPADIPFFNEAFISLLRANHTG